jgi:hypothetical protein
MGPGVGAGFAAFFLVAFFFAAFFFAAIDYHPLSFSTYGINSLKVYFGDPRSADVKLLAPLTAER